MFGIVSFIYLFIFYLEGNPVHRRAVFDVEFNISADARAFDEFPSDRNSSGRQRRNKLESFGGKVQISRRAFWAFIYNPDDGISLRTLKLATKKKRRGENHSEKSSGFEMGGFFFQRIFYLQVNTSAAPRAHIPLNRIQSCDLEIVGARI